jgi:hypothetical protein
MGIRINTKFNGANVSAPPEAYLKQMKAWSLGLKRDGFVANVLPQGLKYYGAAL